MPENLLGVKMITRDALISCAASRFWLVAHKARPVVVFDENQLKIRENFQISLDKKADMAQYTIENNDLSELIRQIEKLFPALIS